MTDGCATARSGDGVQYPWERRLGAYPVDAELSEFRIWAPHAESLSLQISGADVELEPAGYGIYELITPAHAGEDYWYVVDGRQLPDPCSRWQPRGLRGPSRVFDAGSLAHRSDGFAAPLPRELVIYELHVGTFTAEGTFAAAAGHMRELAELGVTAIEIMPVAEFPGARGWGYDGVYISCAQSSYGGPAGLAALVCAAHGAGVAVLLDVVYNHLGVSGVKAMEAFGPYFTGKYETPWGRAINYDDADCDPVREWVLQSAVGWVRDFGVDGLRLDAIHAIFDSSPEHIVQAVTRRVHDANPRALVIAESGLNDPRVMRPGERGYGFDAAWADDFHHALRALLTDERDGYYVEFGRVGQLAKALHRPYVHDGDYSSFRRRRFGAPAEDVPPGAFVVFSQNHDQVGNRAYGDRMPAAARPLAAFCTLLSPFVPLLFMGEEYGEPAPFQFFSDHIDRQIAQATREGRRQEFASFAQFGGEIPDPQDITTFERSKLTRLKDPAIARLYAELLRARRHLPRGDLEAIEFDEPARWLRARQGPFELVCNFGREPVRLPCQATTVELASHPEAKVTAGYVKLHAMSGALIR
jgi:maltooligosyltrehalose trehalohydrolase